MMMIYKIKIKLKSGEVIESVAKGSLADFVGKMDEQFAAGGKAFIEDKYGREVVIYEGEISYIQSSVAK